MKLVASLCLCLCVWLMLILLSVVLIAIELLYRCIIRLVVWFAIVDGYHCQYNRFKLFVWANEQSKKKKGVNSVYWTLRKTTSLSLLSDDMNFKRMFYKQNHQQTTSILFILQHRLSSKFMCVYVSSVLSYPVQCNIHIHRALIFKQIILFNILPNLISYIARVQIYIWRFTVIFSPFNFFICMN